MGIYDRDYLRQQRPSFSLGLPQSMVIRVVLVTAAVWLVDGLFFPDSHAVTRSLSVSVGTLFQPWMWWKFISYGLAHDPASASHLILNMFTLWMFGIEVEAIYGPREFLRIYVFLLISGGFAWATGNVLMGSPAAAQLMGASAAVVGMVLLFVLHYPRREVLLFFVIPTPAWVLGVIMVGYDLFSGMRRNPGDHVAYGAHLAGALMAFIYFKGKWNFGRWGELLLGRLRWPSRPKLRVHDPDAQTAQAPEPDGEFSAQVDHILEKISREGEASLTRQERRTLEDASRKYQERRRNGKL